MTTYRQIEILLNPNQHSELALIAKEEERSLSELIREIVDDYLQQRTSTQKQKQALQAVKSLEALRKTIAARNVDPMPDIVEQLNFDREERGDELDRIQRDEI